MKNQVKECMDRLRLTVANTVVSGDPVVVGAINGVAVTSYEAADAKATVATEGVYDLSVKGVNDSGNSAVAVGDRLYFTDGDTPKINKKASGTLFGIALETVGSSSTATIEVALVQINNNNIATPGASIADASAVGGTYSQSEVNALKDKINAIITALETAKIITTV